MNSWGCRQRCRQWSNHFSRRRWIWWVHWGSRCRCREVVSPKSKTSSSGRVAEVDLQVDVVQLVDCALQEAAA